MSLPRGRPRKGMTYNVVLQRWEAIPGAQQTSYQKKKPEFKVRVCVYQPPAYKLSSQIGKRYEEDRINTHASRFTSSKQPYTPSATEIAEQVRINSLRQPWDTAKNIAAFYPKGYVYSLDSDGNLFNTREYATDPYLQMIKKKQQCPERVYMKKITVTGIVYGPSKKYELAAGEWEERDDIVKFVKVRY